MIHIADEDIKKVEQKFDLVFDNESKEFIKCMESKDIQACPGAGKTTSLVAKLDIIANKMPFSDNSGILVLTHTNVAVDEIKKKLGANAKIVLGYPNHVGTFQSFVNKFLAVPMYIKLVGKKPERIDNDIFENLFYNKLSYSNKFGLKEKFKQQATTDIEKEKNVKSFLKSFYIDEDNKLQKFNGKKFDYKHNPPSDTYKKLRDIKDKLFKDGFLIFDDTYYLALKYIADYPNILNIFQKRFKYVFVDEAQDTNDRQFDILDKLFKNSDVVVQKIGDNNQAIFSFSGQKAQGWEIDDDSIEIKNTKRLSSLISEQVKKIAISKQELNGDDIAIKPTIILFDENCIEEVIPRFAELIIEYNLCDIDNAIFKVVGGVAKQNDKGHTIPSYFPDYKKDDDCFSLYDTLQDKLKNCIENKLQLSEYRNMILEIVKECLKRQDIKYHDKSFTKRTILKYLKEYDEQSYNDFKLKLFTISDKLAKKEYVFNDLELILNIILEGYDKILDSSMLKDIIKKYKFNKTTKTSSNIYRHDEDIEIHISTIHSIKGETHTATLVLETFKKGYDISQLIKLLQNKKKLGFEAKKKLLYVAMSRPTHLLCLAIYKNDKITDIDVQLLKDNGFIIIKLQENNNAN